MTKVIPSSRTSFLTKRWVVLERIRTCSLHHNGLYVIRVFRLSVILLLKSRFIFLSRSLTSTQTLSSSHFPFHTLTLSHTPLNGLFLGYRCVSLHQTWLLILARRCIPDIWQPAWLETVVVWLFTGGQRKAKLSGWIAVWTSKTPLNPV